jgi:hypothetical protein
MTLRSAAFLLGALIVSTAPVNAADVRGKAVFICRSPLLAFDFQKSLQELRVKGVSITPQLAQQICDGMRAGNDPQCRRIEVTKVRPISAGSGGALALSDQGTRVWFHNPDSGGWVAPEYYVWLVNSPASQEIR